MTYAGAFRAVIEAMRELSVPHMLGESVASIFYGMPSSGLCADLVIAPGKTSIRAVADRLGPAFRLDSPAGRTEPQRHQLTAVELGFVVDVFPLTADAYDQARFRRRVRSRLLDTETCLPTPEDVIVTKLRWLGCGQRTTDREALRAVIAVQAGRLDWDYVHRWCDEHGTRQLLDDVRRSVPPT